MNRTIGRPKIPEGEQLSENVFSCLLPEERREFEMLAREQSRTLSAQLRHLVRQAIAERVAS